LQPLLCGYSGRGFAFINLRQMAGCGKMEL